MSLPLPPTLPTCYRHPGREAGRSCTRCGKPACSECLVQATVGSHCLDCAKAARPDLKTRVKYANARVLTPVTMAIIGLNCVVFIYTALGGGDALFFGGNGRTYDLALSKLVLQGFIPDVDGSIAAGDLVFYPEHQWYRLITSGFIHYGIIHLALNMWSIYLLGGVLERKLGAVRFALLYGASLLGGSAGVVLIQPDGGLAGGASGAVFGLMCALVVSLWQQGVNPLNSDIGQVFMMNLFITFAGRSFISVGGHLGGALAGAALSLVMLSKPWKPAPKWATYVAPVVVATLAIGAIVTSVT